MSKNKKIRKLASDKLPFDMLTPKQQAKRAKRNTAYLQEHGFGAADHLRQVYGKGMVERFPFHIRLKEGQGLTYQSFMDANEQLRRQELLEQREREARMPNRFIDERHVITSEEAVRLFMERLGVTQLQPQAPIFGRPVFSPESMALTKVPNPSNKYTMHIESGPTGAKAWFESPEGKTTPVPYVSVWREENIQEWEREQLAKVANLHQTYGVPASQPRTPPPVSEFGLEFGFTDNPNPWKELKSLNRRDEFHRRAQKAEGAAKYLYKSMRQYQDMLARFYYLIGVEIGRGARFMVDPVPLIRDAPLMTVFTNELHRGYRDGERLSPEHRNPEQGESSITEATE